MFEKSAQATPELSSNLYEIRNRINNTVGLINLHCRRLDRKSAQLMSLAPQTSAPFSGLAQGKDFPTAERPLLAEINDGLMQLDSALEELACAVSVIETI